MKFVKFCSGCNVCVIAYRTAPCVTALGATQKLVEGAAGHTGLIPQMGARFSRFSPV